MISTRFMIATAVALVGLDLSVTTATAQVASAVVKEGDALDGLGLPGHTITVINTPAVNHVQGWAAGISSSDGATTLSSVFGSVDSVASPMVLQTEATYGPLVQTSFETRTGISNAGQICYSASGTGGPAPDGGFDSVWVGSNAICLEGANLPAGPLSALFWTFGSAPTITGNGIPFFVAGTDDTSGGSSSARGLFTDSGTPLLYSGETPAGLPAPLDDSGSPVSFDFAVSANGNQYLAEVEMETTGTGVPTSADNALVLSGAGLLIDGQLVQETLPVPASAGALPDENWDNFDYYGINEFGDFLFTGDTDAATTSDEIVVVNGQIVLRELDVVGPFTIDGDMEAAHMNESGDWAVIWDVGDAGVQEALIFNGQVVFVEGEAVDIDNDGTPDPAWLLTDFNGLSGGVKVGDRDASGEVDVYVDADVNSSGFEIEALLRVSLMTTPGQDGDLELKVIDAPDPVITIGGPINYNVLVRNNGSTAVTGVVVTSNLPGTVNFDAGASDPVAMHAGGVVTASLGTLQPNEVASYTFVVDTTVAGNVTVTSSVAANEADPLPGNNSATNDTFVGLITDLQLDIADAPDPVREPNVPIIYTLTATNNGPSDATGVVVTFNLDPTTTFNAGLSDPIAMEAAGVVTANIGALASGASTAFDVGVDTTVQGTLSVSGNITGTQEDPDLGNNDPIAETLFERSADLAVVASDTPDPLVLVGGDITYVLEVTNNGPSTATATTASLTLDDRTAFVSATGGATHDGSPTGGVVSLALGDLLDGDTGGFTVVAQTLEAGRIVAVASAAADPQVSDPDPTDSAGAVNTLVLEDLVGLPLGVFSNITSSGTSNVPGLPGAKFGTGINRSFRSPDGKTYILTADTDLATSMDEVIIIGSLCGADTVVQEGVTILAEGDIVGFIDDQLSITDAGQYAFATNTDAATTMDEVIVKWDGSSFVTVAREGGFAAPTGFNYGSILNSPNIIFDNTVWFIGDTDGPTATDAFVFKKNGNEVLLQEGVSIPLGQDGGAMSPWDNFDANDLSVDAMGVNWLQEGDTEDATAIDDILAANNNVVVQEGVILPGSGFSSPADASSPLDYSQMQIGGDWLARGGNDDNQDWVLRNGVVVSATGDPIATGAAEDFSDAPFAATYFGFAGNNAGDYVIGGTTDAAESSNNAVLVLNGTTVIAREDDPIDLDGNGQLDDGVRVRTFGNDDAILTEDLQLYTTCTLRAFDDSGSNTDIGDAYIRYNLCGIAGPCGDLDNDKDVDGGDFTLFLLGFASTRSSCQSANGTDNCADGAEAISGNGEFSFDLTSATTDGVADPSCLFFGQDQIDNDVWFCWTAQCTGTVTVDTCALTGVDSKIAVYDGCACDAPILACNDDACGLQTRLNFAAVADNQYLLRVGTFPGAAGGTGSFAIRCGGSGGVPTCGESETCNEAYHPCADFDDDGVISQVDYQEWLLCYRAFVGNPLAAPPAVPSMPDYDNDGDVDLADVAAFQRLASADQAEGFLCTLRFDYDRNERVEAADFARFDAAFAGPEQ